MSLSVGRVGLWNLKTVLWSLQNGETVGISLEQDSQI